MVLHTPCAALRCFGALASVYAWERIGHLFCHIARVLLHMPLLRYVDDFFCPERWAASCHCACIAGRWFFFGRKECAEHGMVCFAHLVRTILGATSMNEKKLEHGPCLVVLGVEVSMTLSGYSMSPARPKIEKCLEDIGQALTSGVLQSGAAQKLAGRLVWSTQYIFSRLGLVVTSSEDSARVVGQGLQAADR